MPLCLVFLYRIISKTNGEAPFDLAEAESRLVNWFYDRTLYDYFLSFFLAEYVYYTSYLYII